jgi:aconitate hydratase
MYKNLLKKSFSSRNPFQSTAHKSLKLGSNTFNYYDMNSIGDICKILFLIIAHLPISIRVLLESSLRNCDEFQVKSKILFF